MKMTEQQDRPFITLDNIKYNLDEFPEELKVMAIDLVRVDQELTELNFKTRVHNLAKQYLISQIKTQTTEQGILGTNVT